MVRTFAVLMCAVALLALAACGGGSSNGNQPKPPVFTSTPPSTANEGDVYSYTVTASDPAGGAVTLELTSAPTGASLNGNTLTWTPTTTQARQSQSFVITAKTTPVLTSTQSWNITPTGTIRGTAMDTFYSLDPTMQLPFDMSNSEIEAVVPNADGTSTVLNGVGRNDGTFSIAKVPGGYYWLYIDGYHYWTDSSTFDYGTDIFGRWDAAYGTANVNANLTGLGSWTGSDHVEWIAPNVNGSYQFVSGLPDATTSWGGQVVVNQTNDPPEGPLPDAGRGDQSWIYQVHGSPAFGTSGLALTRLEKFAGPLALTWPVNSTTSLDSSLGNQTLDQSFRFKVSGSEFASMFSQVQPGVTMWELTSYLELQPFDVGGRNLSNGGNWPLLLQVYGGAAANGGIATDVDYGDLPYGSPFPSSYLPVFVYNQTVSIGYQLSGTNAADWEDGYLGHQTTTLPTVDQPVRPLLSPVTNAKVDGKDFFTDATVNTLTPTVSWSAPTTNRTGAPVAYDVGVFRLFKDANGATSREPVARLLTMTTSIKIPPNILQRSNSYFLWIFAIADPRTDNSKSPERMGFPDAWSETLSAVFTTSGSASAAQPAAAFSERAVAPNPARRISRRPMPYDLRRLETHRQHEIQ